MNIVTMYHRKVAKTGYYEYHSQQSYKAVMRQINEVLSTIQTDCGSAGDKSYEWMSTADRLNIQDIHRLFPKGEALVTMRHGANEGYFIDVLVICDTDEIRGHIKRALSIKFLSDKEFVGRATLLLVDAFNNGLYELQEPKQII